MNLHFIPHTSYYTHTKKNLKWISDLNIKAKTIKLLDENKKEYLWGLGLGKDFLDMTTEAQSIEGEGRKLINYSSNRHHYKNEKINHTLAESICKIIYLIKDLYPDYIANS